MAQVNYTDYQNPFPQTYLGFGNSLGNTALFDNGSFFMAGGIIFSFKQHSLGMILYKSSPIHKSIK